MRSGFLTSTGVKAAWWRFAASEFLSGAGRMKTILILEGSDECTAGFQKALAELGGDFQLKIWRHAHSMMAECAAFFPIATLICLGHDPSPEPLLSP
jgi:hypothetical protein